MGVGEKSSLVTVAPKWKAGTAEKTSEAQMETKRRTKLSRSSQDWGREDAECEHLTTGLCYHNLLELIYIVYNDVPERRVRMSGELDLKISDYSIECN